SARAQRRPQARHPPPARAHALLSRRRRGRARGRRPHHPVRDPRRRVVRAGAGTRHAQRRGMDARAQNHDRGARRPHRAGGQGGADRAWAWLSRRAPFARRTQGRERRRADRARAGGRARNSAGFYLQPAVGGLVLPVSFWRRFAAIENVLAIKVAPFNRYRSLDVIRGVVEADAADRVTLYTGNDDHIILDLVTPFTVVANGREHTVRIKGGLLGHWSVWVKRAVELLERIHAAVAKNEVSA